LPGHFQRVVTGVAIEIASLCRHSAISVQRLGKVNLAADGKAWRDGVAKEEMLPTQVAIAFACAVLQLQTVVLVGNIASDDMIDIPVVVGFEMGLFRRAAVKRATDPGNA